MKAIMTLSLADMLRTPFQRLSAWRLRRRPFDEFEQQPVGDFGDGFGLGGLPSPEQEFLRHRAGLVDGQDEGCAVAPRDTLGVHYRIPLTVW